MKCQLQRSFGLSSSAWRSNSLSAPLCPIYPPPEWLCLIHSQAGTGAGRCRGVGGSVGGFLGWGQLASPVPWRRDRELDWSSCARGPSFVKMSLAGVLAAQGCPNKVPQTGQL